MDYYIIIGYSILLEFLYHNTSMSSTKFTYQYNQYRYLTNSFDNVSLVQSIT